jgi:hypothetical protein
LFKSKSTLCAWAGPWQRPSRGPPRADTPPPFSSQMPLEPHSFSPSDRTANDRCLESPPRHRTAPASELTVRGEPRLSTASGHPRHSELLQQGATTERHGAPELPVHAEPASSARWCPVRLSSTRSCPILVRRRPSPFSSISSPWCYPPRLGAVPRSPPLSFLVRASCSSPWS